MVRVAPLLRLRSLGVEAYDYLVPDDWQPAPAIGEVVRVPFARRTVSGVVVGVGSSGEVPPSRMTALVGRTGETVSGDLLDLARTMARHYLAPLGACLRVVAPPYLLAGERTASERRVAWVRPTAAAGKPTATEDDDLTPRQAEVLAAVKTEGEPVSRLTLRLSTSRSVVAALVGKGELETFEAPLEQFGEGSDRSAATGVSAEDRGTGPPIDDVHKGASIDLTDEQRRALDALEPLLEGAVFAHSALWGVTGSGKTEIYLQLADKALAAGKSVIVLVPEIALTFQTVRRFQERFGDRVAVLHSALASARRSGEYRRIARGEARLVIGARSAVTAPVRDLGLVIVDESHEGSYKQEDEPRYDARTVAMWRARAAGGLLVEGSATPRAETLVDARPLVRLHHRPAGARLPDVEIVDLRRQGASGMLAPIARDALRNTMLRGEQAVVLLNRRGYAGYLQCPDCGEVVMCDRCEISLTYYRRDGQLRCHHCGRRAPAPRVCPGCGSASLTRRNPGTERLSDELGRIVQPSGLFRLDSDTVTSSGRVEEVLAGFAAARPAVLVGTQMVAKGHDFPGVTTVIVADADTGLYMPDFRAAERTFQLLTQVAGRAGRTVRPGRVYVQTWNPEVACIRMALDRRPDAFYREELALRRRLGYPPYRQLVRVVVSGRDEDRVATGSRYLAERLRQHLPREVVGPARLPNLRRHARHHLLVSFEEGSAAKAVLSEAVRRLGPAYRKRGLDVMVDVEPQSFM